jgi:hypothetical protein
MRSGAYAPILKAVFDPIPRTARPQGLEKVQVLVYDGFNELDGIAP